MGGAEVRRGPLGAMSRYWSSPIAPPGRAISGAIKLRRPSHGRELGFAFTSPVMGTNRTGSTAVCVTLPPRFSRR